MEHRRGFGKCSALAALLCAAAIAGCGGADAPTPADTGVSGDLGKLDGAMVEDTGGSSDTGATDDGGATSDNGTGSDAGMGSDAGDGGAAMDAGSDAGSPVDGGGGDGGVRPDGGAGRAHAGASLVSAGSLMRSANFQMISTLGGRSVQQTTLQSPNFRLRGGLVGSIGAR